MTPKQFEAFVRQRAVVHGVDPDFAVGMWRAETGGQVGNVVGDNGRSVGPWQILDTTSPTLGLAKADRVDPIKSTEAVMPLIRRLSDRARGDWALTRLGYMRGEGAIDNPEKYRNHPIAGGNMRRFAALQRATQGKTAAQVLALDGPDTNDAAAVLGLTPDMGLGPTMGTPQETAAAAPTPQFDAAMFNILGIEDDTWQQQTSAPTA